MNKKKIFIVVFLVLGIITLLLGSAYAFFTFRARSKNNNLTFGGISLSYVEGISTINLSNVLPILDEEGMVSDNKFTFNVNGYSDNAETLVEYSIEVVDGNVPEGYSEENRLDDIAVKVYLEDSNKKQVYLESPSNGSIIYKNIIKGGTEENQKEHVYTLRMWVSDKVLISNTVTLEDHPEYEVKYTTEEYSQKFASIKVNIRASNINEANAPVLPDGMIPIKYNETIHEWVKADINNLNDDWYNYYDKKWANAVMLKETSTDNTSFSGLPSEYTELEYIESTGTQYILTDQYPAGGWTIKSKYYCDDDSNRPVVYGGRDAPYVNAISNSVHRLDNYVGSAYGSAYMTGSYANNNTCGRIHVVEQSSNGIIIDGNFNSYQTGSSTFGASSYPLALFALNANGTISNSNMFNGKIYYIQIYDSGNNLIANYVPSVRTSDSEVGMYDTIGGVFYDSEVEDNFIAGPEGVYATSSCTGTNSYCTRSDYKNASVGTIIPEEDILAYYVWVPRYKYQLFNVSTSATVSPQEIQIEFEKGIAKTGLGTTDGTYLTHPAFTLGTDELKGIWVGKFETTPDATNPTIKPNKESLREQNVSTQFATSQKFALNADSYYLDSNTNIDSYMAKNSDWGAVAYLSHSKYGINSEIYINNSSSYFTGRSAGSVGSATTTTSANGTYTYDGKDTTTNEYISDITLATKASTTGNITGIYDMSGGAWEYVMGVLGDTSTPAKPRSGRNTTDNSGFTGMLSDGSEYKGDPEVLFPNLKYYQLYGTSINSSYLGDALGETKYWYGDYRAALDISNSWLARGSYSSNGAPAGVFSFRTYTGSTLSNYSFRSVLTNK